MQEGQSMKFHQLKYLHIKEKVACVSLMGCFYSKTPKHTPGYEDPSLLAAETPCKYEKANKKVFNIIS